MLHLNTMGLYLPSPHTNDESSVYKPHPFPQLASIQPQPSFPILLLKTCSTPPLLYFRKSLLPRQVESKTCHKITHGVVGAAAEQINQPAFGKFRGISVGYCPLGIRL